MIPARTHIGFVSALICASMAALVACHSTPPPQPQSGTEAQVLPRPEQPFGGKIGRTPKDSTPDFPKSV